MCFLQVYLKIENWKLKRLRLHPNLLVALLLLVWWLLNLVMAACVELANDEAYYWWWATGCGLDWGYFDHPPAVACLIWLTSWFPGEIGVRFATTLLQPLYLFMLWRLWVSEQSATTTSQALVFAGVSFSIPLLQLYGLLALPDAPLLFSSTLFICLLCRLYKKPTPLNAVMVGAATAMVGYCKYQGILIVATGFVVYVVNAFLTKKSDISGDNENSAKKTFSYQLSLCLVWIVVAALLYLPHLLWLYQDDFATFHYHFVGRYRFPYSPSFTIEYLLNLIAVFNPLLIWFIVKAVCRKKKHSDIQTFKHSNIHAFKHSLMLWTLLVYVVFFFLASFRGYTQPQWTLVAVIPAVWFVTDSYSHFSVRTCKALRIVLYASVAVMLCLRVLVLFNPFHFKGEVWNNHTGFEAIAAVAKDRPLVVQHNYTLPCKYMFYTQRQACSIPLYFERDSQWRYSSADSALAGKSVVVIVPDWRSGDTIHRLGASDLHYIVIDDYLPLSRMCIQLLGAKQDDFNLHTSLRITNPYPYPICPSEERGILLRLSAATYPQSERSCVTPLRDTIPAHSTIEITCTFPLGDVAEVLYDRPIRLGIESDGILAAINSTSTMLLPQE